MFSFCPQTLVYMLNLCVWEMIWFISQEWEPSTMRPIVEWEIKIESLKVLINGQRICRLNVSHLKCARDFLRPKIMSEEHASFKLYIQIEQVNTWGLGTPLLYFFSFVLFILCVDVDSMLEGTFYWNGITVGTTWCLSSLFIYWVIQVRHGHVEASERWKRNEGRRDR